MIKRFRDLDMPLEQIRELLATSDTDRRAAVLREHIDQLIDELGRMRDATERLDELLAPRTQWPQVEQRTMPARAGIAIRDTVEMSSAMDWLHGVLAELGATLRRAKLDATGPAFGLYEDGIFTDGIGEGMVPGRSVRSMSSGRWRPRGRLTGLPRSPGPCSGHGESDWRHG